MRALRVEHRLDRRAIDDHGSGSSSHRRRARPLLREAPRRPSAEGGPDGIVEPQQRPQARQHLDLLRLRHRRGRPPQAGVQRRVPHPQGSRGRPHRSARRPAVGHVRASRSADRGRLPRRRVAAHPATADARGEHLRVLRAVHPPARPALRRRDPAAAAHADGPELPLPHPARHRPADTGAAEAPARPCSDRAHRTAPRRRADMATGRRHDRRALP